jgi:hypothetical protein
MAAGDVLTEASTLVCGHPSAGTITIPGSPRLRVGGATVLTMPVPPTAPVAGCLQPTASGSAPCATAALTGGAATRLHVDGLPVLLAATFTASTTGLPSVPAQVRAAGQDLLRAE